MVKLYVGNVWTKMYGLSAYDIQQFTERLRFRPKSYIFSKKYQDGKWDGWVNLFMNRGGNYIVYTGLVPRIIKMLNADGIAYDIVREYKNSQIKINDIKLNGITLRDYQENIVKTCKKKKRGIIKAATGSGKTEIFIKLAADIPVKTLIVVNRSTLFRQVREKLVDRLAIEESEINYIGDEKSYDPKKRITVATFQSLISKENSLTKGKYGGKIKKQKLKWDSLLKDIEMLLVDEVHHLSANELGMLLKGANKTLFRFGFSATPQREDGYDMMLEALIGPKIYDLPISNLIKKGYLAKPKIYIFKQPYYIDKKFSFKESYEILMNNEQRNRNIAEIAYKFARKGKIVLISFVRLDHLKYVYDYLQELNEVELTIKKVTGSNTSEQKRKAIEKMNNGEYNIVLSTLFGEGVDIPNLDVLVNPRSVKSSIDAYQQVGRVLRMVKGKTPIVIDFFDYNSYDDSELKDYFKKFAKIRLKLFKSEPEFELHEISSIDEIEEV